jgi:hypothetical protein
LLLAKHWHDIGNRKLVFYEFAQQQGFDPLVASNWYSVSYHLLSHYKVIFLFKLISDLLNYLIGTQYSVTLLRRQFLQSIAGRFS